jgi:hypothetical protein
MAVLEPRERTSRYHLGLISLLLGLLAGLLLCQSSGDPSRQAKAGADLGRQILLSDAGGNQIPDSRLHTATSSTILERF